mmetsp:Transcript_18049/g.26809  ORF Transcript_18049/g.26809 Transcript_18049/m.26809 type:complete len:211 (-) Transcript_18049:1169-1801(-)
MRKSLNVRYLGTQTGCIREAEFKWFPNERRLLDVVNTLDQFLHLSSTLFCGCRLLEFELTNPFSILINPLLLSVVCCIPSIHTTLFQFKKPRIISIIFSTYTSLCINNLVTNSIQKFTIVTDTYHRNVLLAKEIFKPFNTLQVKMVCRFIQEQDIGILQQHFSKTDSHLPSSRKHCNKIIFFLVFKSHQVHGFLCLAFKSIYILALSSCL